MSIVVLYALKFLFFLLFEIVGAWNGVTAVSRLNDYLKTRKTFSLFFFFLHAINSSICAGGAIWVLFRVLTA